MRNFRVLRSTGPEVQAMLNSIIGAGNGRGCARERCEPNSSSTAALVVRGIVAPARDMLVVSRLAPTEHPTWPVSGTVRFEADRRAHYRTSSSSSWPTSRQSAPTTSCAAGATARGCRPAEWKGCLPRARAPRRRAVPRSLSRRRRRCRPVDRRRAAPRLRTEDRPPPASRLPPPAVRCRLLRPGRRLRRRPLRPSPRRFP